MRSDKSIRMKTADPNGLPAIAIRNESAPLGTRGFQIRCLRWVKGIPSTKHFADNGIDLYARLTVEIYIFQNEIFC